jgi:hypothetical protein
MMPYFRGSARSTISLAQRIADSPQFVDRDYMHSLRCHLESKNVARMPL